MCSQNRVVTQTERVPRPTGRESRYRRQPLVSLERDQVQWDVVDAYQREDRCGEIRPSAAEIRRAELETRVRLAYLATADGSAPEWERSRTRIIAEYLHREKARAAQSTG